MLTPAQLNTLAAAITANATWAQWRTDTNYAEIYNALNALAAPAFVVWRSTIPVAEYRNALTWTEVDALTAGKARIWEWVTGGMTLPLETGKAAVRTGLADCWAANSATRASLLAVGKRSATVGEKLFATGTGSDASPASLVVEGQINFDDVVSACQI